MPALVVVARPVAMVRRPTRRRALTAVPAGALTRTDTPRRSADRLTEPGARTVGAVTLGLESPGAAAAGGAGGGGGGGPGAGAGTGAVPAPVSNPTEEKSTPEGDCKSFAQSNQQFCPGRAPPSARVIGCRWS